jgi:F-type H+/Na+-transporting ATPase subunit beta
VSNPNQGTVVAVRGSVIDARFPQRIPSLHNLLTAGDQGRIKIEVQTHLKALGSERAEVKRLLPA